MQRLERFRAVRVIFKREFIIVSMKRDNCIDVKHVSHLSVNYLSRFFGSVGPVSKVEKDEVSKYVTIVCISTFSNLLIGTASKKLLGSTVGY